MRDAARVLTIAVSETVTDVVVVPLLTDTCINCGEAQCAKQGKPFTVSNPKKLPLSIGTIVKIAASPQQQAVQAFTAVGLPIAAGAAGYFLPSLFTTRPPEVVQVCTVLAAFLLTALTVLWINRHSSAKKNACIAEIVSPSVL